MKALLSRILLGVFSLFVAKSVLHAQESDWHTLSVPQSNPYTCIFFWSLNSGVILTSNGSYFTNDGQHLHPCTLPTNSIIPYCIREIEGEVYALVFIPLINRTQIWKNTDLGATWHVVMEGPRVGTDFYFINGTVEPILEQDARNSSSTIVRVSKHLWFKACDDESNIQKTTNAGESWISIHTPFTCGFGMCYNFSGNKLYVRSEDGRLFMTSDQGRSWWQINLPFPGSSAGYDEIVGYNNNLYIQTSNQVAQSTNGGITWQTIGGPGTGGQEDRRICFRHCITDIIAVYDQRNTIYVREFGPTDDKRSSPLYIDSIVSVPAGSAALIQVKQYMDLQEDTLHFALSFPRDILGFDRVIEKEVSCIDSSVDDSGIETRTFAKISALGQNTLASIVMRTFLSKQDSARIDLHYIPSKAGQCSIWNDTSIVFHQSYQCKDSTLRDFLITSKLPKLQIVPNPANNYIRLQSSKEIFGSISIRIINLFGESLYSNTLSSDANGFNDVRIPIETLAPGTYILQLQSSYGIQTVSFIIER